MNYTADQPCGHGPSEARANPGFLQIAISRRHWLLYVTPSVPHLGLYSLVHAFSHEGTVKYKLTTTWLHTITMSNSTHNS